MIAATRGPTAPTCWHSPMRVPTPCLALSPDECKRLAGMGTVPPGPGTTRAGTAWADPTTGAAKPRTGATRRPRHSYNAACPQRRLPTTPPATSRRMDQVCMGRRSIDQVCMAGAAWTRSAWAGAALAASYVAVGSQRESRYGCDMRFQPSMANRMRRSDKRSDGRQQLVRFARCSDAFLFAHTGKDPPRDPGIRIRQTGYGKRHRPHHDVDRRLCGFEISKLYV